MRVTLSVGGKFHFFNLAQQLLRRSYLERLITSYPKFEVVKQGIPKEKISSVLIKEVLERGWKRMPSFLRAAYNPQFLIHETFDRIAAHLVPPSDIVVAASSFGLYTLRRARMGGAVAVLERGSSHIAYQDKILREEYERFGVPLAAIQLAHPKIIERELAEYEEADYIAVPSLFAKNSFLEYGVPEKKLIHVPYGVDLSLFHQVPKTDKVFRVIFGGGLTLRKGTHYLLQAFAELKLPNSELLLIGAVNDEIKPFLKKYEGHYTLMSYRSMAELHKWYSQGSVFVMPSLEEGLAMVQPQAMACGLPLVTTTNTGGEDIVRDGIDGFVIPIRSVEKLKEKILYFYEHPEKREEMGRSAKERVASGFTWDDYGARMCAAYERILNVRTSQ